MLEDFERVIFEEIAEALTRYIKRSGKLGESEEFYIVYAGNKFYYKKSDGKDINDKINAIKAISKLKSNATVRILVDLLWSNKSSIRAAAAEALGNIGDKVALDFLLLRLEDNSHLVRMAVAESLGKIGDTKVIPFLVKLLNTNNKSLKIAAIISIVKINDPEGIKLLKQHWGKEIDEDVKKIIKIQLETRALNIIEDLVKKDSF